MAKIHKLIKDGQTIYPATTTDAVVHPTTRKNLTESLSLLDNKNLLLSCVTSSSNLIIKNGDNLNNWEDDKILNNDGDIVKSNGYSTTDFIEYEGQYGAYSALMYEAASIGVSYPLLAYYDLASKKHIKSFYLVGGQRTILIPPGYCVRVSTKTNLKKTLIFKASAELETAPFSVNEIPDESIDNSKIKNKTISTGKIDEGLFSKLQYSVGIISNENVVGNEIAINWTDNYILSANGQIIESKSYSVSDFIDYSGNYGQYQALMFFPCIDAISYGTVAYYDKDNHNFKVSFPVFGAGKTTILIPPNYAVRLVTNTDRKSNIILGVSTKKRELPDNIVTTEKLADKSVTNEKILDKSISFSKMKEVVFEEENKTEKITASEETTELKEGLYYGGQFHEEPEGNFWTIVFKQVINKYDSLDLSNYAIGDTGGAILDKNGNVVEEFSTANGGDSDFQVPVNAYKLAMTINKNYPYGNYVIGKDKVLSTKFSIPDLVLQKGQSGEVTYNGNQWFGKKYV